ncbi:DUF2961 domain-containing protein [Mucilaginibacter sp. JRF]|uniref:glycoside hydrolase family 172 protein n=1 Tax=Mucilaginibacter sp. JRF TaxID=2780088 RepID=UPI00187FC4DD|nr:glycoside hydrolase family 172 protein [Mucilaginibacter sp. JRF]MBE9584458.1 DUF2961 domain-containing protein [Mucilaginibacter sp. JRF]
MKSKILCITGWLILATLNSFGQNKVTLASLLKEMTDPEAVTRMPKPAYILKQTSSYDRHSIAPGKPGWFANDDHTHYIRKEVNSGRTEQVMLDEDGPGAIVRFWETTFKRPGKLRIYFDNETDARITIDGYDLMKFPYAAGKALLAPHSSYEPLQKGGSTLYLPLPFSKHCKVTWQEADSTAKEPRYYQINFRRYPKGTRVETFSDEVFARNTQLITQVNEQLLNPKHSPSIRLVHKVAKDLKPGDELPLKLGGSNTAIGFIQVWLDDSTAYTDKNLRSLYIKAEFDGKTTINCPVSDFFGSGAGNNAIQSWYRTVTSGDVLECRWVMPYTRSVRISIINMGDTMLHTHLEADSQPYKWTSRSMYFNAATRAQKDVPIRRTEADKPLEWDLLNLTGKGVFMGETLAIDNHIHKWYGEGDQKLWVDGEPFPSEYGTGLEDYYNTSWAPVVLYQTPFANAVRADQPDSFGENTFTRTRNLDAVPFDKSFRFSLEMLGWDNGTADVTATSYWYAR